MAKKPSKKAQKYVSKKISKLKDEGYPQDQAIAYSYARGEGYKVGKKKKK